MGERSILFVDDDRFFQEAIGEFLKEHGYEVRQAMDGLEALEAVQDERPAFIILDLIMPKVDGGRVCRYLREDPRYRDIPIVVFSALAARDIAEMPDVSADAYVAKGPLQIVTKNVLAAIRHLEAHGRSGRPEDSVYGYEGFRPRRVVGELLNMKRDSDLLLQSMSEGVLKADEKDQIFYVSPIARAMLEKGEWELIGARLWEAFGPAHRDEVERTAGTLRSDVKATRQELTFTLKGKQFRASFVPLWSDQAYAGLLVILGDISHLRGR